MSPRLGAEARPGRQGRPPSHAPCGATDVARTSRWRCCEGVGGLGLRLLGGGAMVGWSFVIFLATKLDKARRARYNVHP